MGYPFSPIWGVCFLIYNYNLVVTELLGINTWTFFVTLMHKITPYKYSWNFVIPRICTVTRDWKERWRKIGANKVLKENWTNDRSSFNVNVVFDRGRFEFRLRTSAYRSMRLANLYLWTDRSTRFRGIYSRIPFTDV